MDTNNSTYVSNHAVERFGERVKTGQGFGPKALRQALLDCISSAELSASRPEWLGTGESDCDGYLVAGDICVPFRDVADGRVLLTVLTRDLRLTGRVAARRRIRRNERQAKKLRAAAQRSRRHPHSVERRAMRGLHASS